MGLEVVVRPAILPNIRPGVARRIAPPDDPTKGICTLGGSGSGTFIGTSHSFSMSYSSSKPHKEAVRVVDTERVYQKDGSGNINKDNFVEVDRMKKVRLNTSEGPLKVIYASPPKPNNVETIQADKIIGG